MLSSVISLFQPIILTVIKNKLNQKCSTQPIWEIIKPQAHGILSHTLSKAKAMYIVNMLMSKLDSTKPHIRDFENRSNRIVSNSSIGRLYIMSVVIVIEELKGLPVHVLLKGIKVYKLIY